MISNVSQRGSRRPVVKDGDVRDALHKKVLAEHHGEPDTLVLDELGLEHGSCRVDIAVINGMIHGYEIKSDADTLERLPFQAQVYSRTLDKVTLVCGAGHIDKATAIVPEWWGIKLAVGGSRGAVHFEDVRRPKLNRTLDAEALAMLLWRNEALALLEAVEAGKGMKSKSRAALYKRLTETMPLQQLRDQVRACLKSRTQWRPSASSQTSGGD
ncbi:sce7726 family protein [Oleisolibacter albus]|uniref:sce7726 family protein n=1 Tax=Oleisolibacter albus TaxID=2171757 RepID=UPI000DF2FE9F|nr:sce7726 family protein [Oleisolibacter albus]